MTPQEKAQKIAAGDTDFLVDAIESGNIDLMKEIINAGVIPINAPIHHFSTPALYLSVQATVNSEPMTKFLLDKGADPDHRSSGDDSPFLAVIRTHNYKTANLIVDAMQKKYATDPVSMLNAIKNLGPYIESPEQTLRKHTLARNPNSSAQQLLTRISSLISPNGAYLVSGSTSVAAPISAASRRNRGNTVAAIPSPEPLLSNRERQRKEALNDQEHGF